jgi:hypothetical protein
VSIHDRPPEVDGRLIPGHWEGDLIKGKGNRSAVGTVVERTTLFTVLAKMETASAEYALQGFGHVLNRIEAQKRLSMTYDQNLENRHNPFENLIDEGTVTPISPKDFYSIDVDHERIFKSLLRFVLQQKLFRHRVLWKHQEGIFIFLPLDDKDDNRRENWTGHRFSTRTVFERKYNYKDHNKVLSTRHFAFSTDFLILNGKWYLSITPDWFFSYGDIYRRSGFSEKLLSGLKRLEKNRSVFDQFRFLSYWLSNLDSEDLFSTNEQSVSTLSFGNGVTFLNSPMLDESLWEPLTGSEIDEYSASTQNIFNLP